MKIKNDVPHLLILAGGLGTRLSSTIGGTPKSLAPVGNVSFIEILIETYKRQGVRRFTFLLGYKADLIIAELDRLALSRFSGCNFDYIVEPSALGTGGAVANAVQLLKLDHSFLVANSDTYVQGAVDPLTHAGPNSVGVIFEQDARRFGLLDIDVGGAILKFIEKPNVKTSGFINSGVCHLTPDSFKMWSGHPFSLEEGILGRLAKERKLQAVPLNGRFCDIGVPDSYFQFKQNWEINNEYC